MTNGLHHESAVIIVVGTSPSHEAPVPIQVVVVRVVVYQHVAKRVEGHIFPVQVDGIGRIVVSRQELLEVRIKVRVQPHYPMVVSYAVGALP